MIRDNGREKGVRVTPEGPTTICTLHGPHFLMMGYIGVYDMRLQVTSIAAGMNVSGCCSADGGLWLWGSNVNYQLAKGEVEDDSLVPEKLKRTKTFGFRNIYSVSFGGQHAALLAGKPVDPQPAAAASALPAPAPASAPAPTPPTADTSIPVPVPDSDPTSAVEPPPELTTAPHVQPEEASN